MRQAPGQLSGWNCLQAGYIKENKSASRTAGGLCLWEKFRQRAWRVLAEIRPPHRPGCPSAHKGVHKTESEAAGQHAVDKNSSQHADASECQECGSRRRRYKYQWGC